MLDHLITVGVIIFIVGVVALLAIPYSKSNSGDDDEGPTSTDA